MIKKTLLFTIITGIAGILSILAPTMPDSIKMILGVASMALTIIVHQFFPTGETPKGWGVALWVTNIGGALIEILTTTVLNTIIPIGYITLIVAIINYVITTVKDYSPAAQERVAAKK